MPEYFRVRMYQKGFELLKQKDYKVTGRAAMKNTATLWRLTVLRLHFGDAAGRRYGYAARRGERRGGKPVPRTYTDRKLRQFGHTRPLEWTGKGKSMATSNHRTVVNKTPTSLIHKATVVINAPVFNIRNAGSGINLRAELTKVLKKETKTLQHRYQTAYIKGLKRKARGKRKTTTIK